MKNYTQVTLIVKTLDQTQTFDELCVLELHTSDSSSAQWWALGIKNNIEKKVWITITNRGIKLEDLNE